MASLHGPVRGAGAGCEVETGEEASPLTGTPSWSAGSHDWRIQRGELSPSASANCARAWALASGARNGGAALREPDARATVITLCQRLERLRRLTEQRLADPAAYGPGSRLDRVYDGVFDEIAEDPALPLRRGYRQYVAKA